MNLIEAAHAAEEAAPVMAGAKANIALLVIFVLIFYFLLWRPQSKRQKAHRELVNSIQKGSSAPRLH